MRAGVLRALLVMCLAGGVVVPDAAAATGDLTQKPGVAGCISETGAGSCGDGRALDGATAVTVSPDGQSAYVASPLSGAVAVFDRAANGTLRQKPGVAGCVSETGVGPCADGTALDAASAVTVSPDGQSAYVASPLSGAVAVFDRAANGVLTQRLGVAGCVSNTGAGPCTDGTALADATSVTVSHDGQSAYVASVLSDAVAVFDRAANGTLTQKPGVAGCISNTGAGPCTDGTALDGATAVTVSPDGQSAYITSNVTGAVAVFDRAANGVLTQKPGVAGCVSETGAGPCTDGTALTGAGSVTVSPDGQSAYVTSYSSGAVAVFDRAANGTLTQKPGVAGCISNTGAGPCADGRDLAAATAVTVSPDGQSAYVTTAFGAVAVLDRAANGTLTQKRGVAGCISETGTGSCGDGTALFGARSVTVSPDGQSAYVASLVRDAVAVFDRAPPGAPVVGRSELVRPVRGVVLVRRRGSRRFVRLRGGQLLPDRSEIDTRRGTARVTVASDQRGGLSTATVSQGRAIIDQNRAARPTTTFRLSEPLACPRRLATAAAARKRKKGDIFIRTKDPRFRTKDDKAAGTSSGTAWRTTSTCTTTTIKVTEGTVRVRDFRRRRTVNVSAPDSYTARR